MFSIITMTLQKVPSQFKNIMLCLLLMRTLLTFDQNKSTENQFYYRSGFQTAGSSHVSGRRWLVVGDTQTWCPSGMMYPLTTLIIPQQILKVYHSIQNYKNLGNQQISVWKIKKTGACICVYVRAPGVSVV